MGESIINGLTNRENVTASRGDGAYMEKLLELSYLEQAALRNGLEEMASSEH
jgi:hypothetical protein